MLIKKPNLKADIACRAREILKRHADYDSAAEELVSSIFGNISTTDTMGIFILGYAKACVRSAASVQRLSAKKTAIANHGPVPGSTGAVPVAAPTVKKAVAAGTSILDSFYAGGRIGDYDLQQAGKLAKREQQMADGHATMARFLTSLADADPAKHKTVRSVVDEAAAMTLYAAAAV